MKVDVMTCKTHNPYEESHWVSRLRENLTSGSDGEGLETGRKVPRQSFTRQVFFKEIKQTLKLSDFVGYNKNAVRWQLWTALLTYILLRFIAWQSKWNHSFIRLFTALRGVIWSHLDMFSVLECCGTAGGETRMRAAPEMAYLPGLAPT